MEEGKERERGNELLNKREHILMPIFFHCVISLERGERERNGKEERGDLLHSSSFL